MRTRHLPVLVLASALLLTAGCARRDTVRPEEAPQADADAAAEGAAPAEPDFAASPVDDWSAPPTPGAEPEWTPPEPVTFELANGLKVVLVEDRRLPLVSAMLRIDGAGSAADPEGSAGLAALTADALDEGAGGLSALEIAETAERLGAEVSVGAGVDGAGVSLSTLARTLPESLKLMATVAMQPDFPDADVARIHADRMTHLKLRSDRPREVASMLLDAVLYGREDPYGHPTAGYVDTLGDLGVDEVRHFYRFHWVPARATLVVAGDVTAARLKTLLQGTLGKWTAIVPRTLVAESAPEPSPESQPTRLVLVDRPGAAQTDVRLGLVGLKRDDPRYYGLEVLNTILGGGFTSRLNNRLREQLGYTYGAGSGMDWRVHAGPFRIGTAVFTPTTANALEETLAILQNLALEAVPESEIVKARQNLVRALPTRFETNLGTVSAYVELLHHGLPLDWYEGYAEAIKQVSPEDVTALASDLWPPERLVLVAVGDVSQIREGLEDLFGPAAIYNAEGRPVEGAEPEATAAP